MKRTCKKLLSVIMAMALCLGMCVGAMAAKITYDGDNTHPYKAYQVLKGTQKENETALGDVKWGDGINKDTFLTKIKAIEVGGEKVFDIDAVNDTDAGAAKFAEILAANTSIANEVAQAAAASVAETATAEIDAGAAEVDVASGYYLIVDAKEFSSTDTNTWKNLNILQVTDSITIKQKNDVPSVDKQVQDETGDAEANATDGWGETADHAINETFQFKLTATIPDKPEMDQYKKYYLKFNDTMSAGVTYDGIESVKVYGKDGTELATLTESQYTLTSNVTDNGTTLGVEIADLKALIAGGDIKGVKVEVVYNAHLNEKAVVGDVDDNDNTVNLDYSRNPNDESGGETGKTPDDTVWVFTYEMDNTKVDGTNNNAPLGGAQFKLYKDDNGTISTEEVGLIYDTEKQAYRPIKAGETATPMESAESTGKFNIIGLDAGTYWLKETKTPDGYNTCADQKITISATHSENADEASATTNITYQQNDSDSNGAFQIVNNKGATLPGTGGIGTTIFYIVGGVLVVGAGVLLITKKRMAK